MTCYFLYAFVIFPINLKEFPKPKELTQAYARLMAMRQYRDRGIHILEEAKSCNRRGRNRENAPFPRGLTFWANRTCINRRCRLARNRRHSSRRAVTFLSAIHHDTITLDNIGTIKCHNVGTHVATVALSGAVWCDDSTG